LPRCVKNPVADALSHSVHVFEIMMGVEQCARLELFLLAPERAHLNLLQVERRIRQSLGGTHGESSPKRWLLYLFFSIIGRERLRFFRMPVLGPTPITKPPAATARPSTTPSHEARGESPA